MNRVFEAWTDPQHVSRWMWASLTNDAWAEIDLRVGGTYRVYTRFADGQHQGEDWSGMCGILAEIERPRKLVYTLHWDADVGYNQESAVTLDEVVVVRLKEDECVTHLDYHHFGIPDDGRSAETHRVGIEESFDFLARLLTESDSVA